MTRGIPKFGMPYVGLCPGLSTLPEATAFSLPLPLAQI